MRKGLLLGAGFSYDLGMPLAVEVTEIFLGIFSKRRAKSLGDLLSKNEPYGKDRPINKAAIHKGMDLLIEYKKNGKNYEEFLARLEEFPWESQSDRDSGHYLFSVFYDILYRTLLAYQNTSYKVMYEGCNGFYSGLTNMLSDEETWIFTLNHDLCLECLAIDFGVPVTYGDMDEITFPRTNVEPNDLIQLSCMQREHMCKNGRGWFAGKRGINLVRLHGGFSELEYKDSEIICNPFLNHTRSSELMAEFNRLESMGYYVYGKRVPSGRDRVITGPDGTPDIVHRTVLTGGNKYSKTMKFKKGEEKLKLFADVMKELDELTIIGYGFGDAHVNYRISNAMVLNENLALRIVDPFYRRPPEFLQQFDYDSRIRGAICRAAEWMSYVGDEKWNMEQSKCLKENEGLRSEIKKIVATVVPR